METTSKINYKAIILSALISTICTVFISTLVVYLFRPELKSTISTPIYIEKGFTSVITIKNFSKNKSIENVELYIAVSNPIVDVVSEVGTSIDYDKGTILINKIHPNTSVSILITTKFELTQANLRLVADSSTSLLFLSEEHSLGNTVIITICIQLITFLIPLIIINYITEKMNIKHTKYVDDQVKTMRSENERINVTAAELRKELDDLQNSTKRIKAYYLVRFSDYVRELTFWKDTIRKLLYIAGAKKLDVKAITDTVTNSLKTYTVKEEQIMKIDEVAYIYTQMQGVKNKE
jgi:hypothetical protein